MASIIEVRGALTTIRIAHANDELLDIVAAVHAVVTQQVAGVPQAGDDGLGRGGNNTSAPFAIRHST
jgi:hypothetical protein